MLSPRLPRLASGLAGLLLAASASATPLSLKITATADLSATGGSSTAAVLLLVDMSTSTAIAGSLYTDPDIKSSDQSYSIGSTSLMIDQTAVQLNASTSFIMVQDAFSVGSRTADSFYVRLRLANALDLDGGSKPDVARLDFVVDASSGGAWTSTALPTDLNALLNGEAGFPASRQELVFETTSGPFGVTVTDISTTEYTPSSTTPPTAPSNDVPEPDSLLLASLAGLALAAARRQKKA